MLYNQGTRGYELVMVGMRHVNQELYEKVLKTPFKYYTWITSEPTNATDPRALAVYVGLSGEQAQKVAYVKKEHAAELYSKYGSFSNTPIKVKKVTNYNKYYAILHVSSEDIEKALTTSIKYSDTDTEVFNLKYLSQKEPGMANNTVNTVIDKNAVAARSAAYLEAGRIANNQAVKLVASKAPLMVKGYVDTPFGKLVVANAAAMAAQKLRGSDARLAKLTEAMMTEAWQEVYQIVDFEKMINDMLSNESIKAALNKLEAPAE